MEGIIDSNTQKGIQQKPKEDLDKNSNEDKNNKEDIEVQKKTQVYKTVLTNQTQDETIYLSESENQLKIYMNLNVTSLKNAIKLKNEGLPENIRNFVSRNCLFYREFQTSQKIKGILSFHYQENKGITVKINLEGESDISYDGFAILNFKNKQEEWEQKSYRIEKQGQARIQNRKAVYEFRINQQSLNICLDNSKVVLTEYIFTRNLQQNNRKYLGIQNIGNSCYLNSVLQILYFIRPIRKIIMETKNPEKLTENLQTLFYKMSEDNSKSVDAENVLKCFSVFNEQQRQQQDIHEFIILLFSELQKELPQVKQFWEGVGEYRTQSIDKKYHSVQKDIFNELDVHMRDSKNSNFSSIVQSLQSLLQDEIVDELINTDQYGKINVTKKRTFQSLPDVLFLNLKRYEYNPQRRQLQKILSSLEYPIKINLSNLLGTPLGIEQHDYTLYAVTIHKGRSPQNGHYYCYINTSSSNSISQWYKFNDSNVSEINIKTVLEKSQDFRQFSYKLNKTLGCWEQVRSVSDQTPYLLVYIRNQVFNEFQQVQYQISKEYIELQIQKKRQLQNIETLYIRVFVLQPSKIHLFCPFNNQQDCLQVPLNKNIDLITQLKQIQTKFLSVVIGTVWKVNNLKKTIKYCGKKYGSKCNLSVERIAGYKKGHIRPDYFLIIPLQMSTQYVKEIDMAQELVLIQVNFQSSQNTKKISMNIIQRNNYNSFISELEKRENRKVRENDNKLFKYKWNDFCQLDLQ